MRKERGSTPPYASVRRSTNSELASPANPEDASFGSSVNCTPPVTSTRVSVATVGYGGRTALLPTAGRLKLKVADAACAPPATTSAATAARYFDFMQTTPGDRKQNCMHPFLLKRLRPDNHPDQCERTDRHKPLGGPRRPADRAGSGRAAAPSSSSGRSARVSSAKSPPPRCRFSRTRAATSAARRAHSAALTWSIAALTCLRCASSSTARGKRTAPE